MNQWKKAVAMGLLTVALCGAEVFTFNAYGQLEANLFDLFTLPSTSDTAPAKVRGDRFLVAEFNQIVGILKKLFVDDAGYLAFRDTSTTGTRLSDLGSGTTTVIQNFCALETPATDTTDNFSIFGDTWAAQTFKTGATAYRLDRVRLQLWRDGTVDVGANTLTISIRAVDGSGLPTGADLPSQSVTYAASNLPAQLSTDVGTTATEIEFPGLTLNADTDYAIVVRGAGLTENQVFWRSKSGLTACDDGKASKSADAGNIWEDVGAPELGVDFLYETRETMKASAGTGVAQFVGKTTTTTLGVINFSGMTGYVAADSLCDSEFTGSHMCSQDEILFTIATKKNTLDTTFGTDWSGFVWVNSGASKYAQTTVFVDDCNGWTDATVVHVGTTWELNSVNGGKGHATPCDSGSQKSLACCK